MFLSRLVASNFRNLSHVELLPSERLNLIYGDNGSGKTSVLEAIYSISRGYSFRTRRFTDLVNWDSDRFILFADIREPGRSSKIGVSRPRIGESQFRLDGRSVQSAGELVALLPTQVIDAHAFSLLEGGPKIRRMFLDWLVFHVKQDFGDIWRQYARAVKQRNSLLRHVKITAADLKPWNIELARHGQAMDIRRQETLQEFLPHLQELLHEWGLSDELPVTVRYAAGWDVGTDLEEQLMLNLERDRKLGYTSIGPHKSDLVIRCHGKEPTTYLSRGQQKTLVSALHVAQVKSLHEVRGVRSIILIDDLPAELDRSNRKRLCSWLSATGCQTFVSGVEIAAIYDEWPPIYRDQAKVFHVKQGSVVEQNYSLGANNDSE